MAHQPPESRRASCITLSNTTGLSVGGSFSFGRGGVTPTAIHPDGGSGTGRRSRGGPTPPSRNVMVPPVKDPRGTLSSWTAASE